MTVLIYHGNFILHLCITRGVKMNYYDLFTMLAICSPEDQPHSDMSFLEKMSSGEGLVLCPYHTDEDQETGQLKMWRCPQQVPIRIKSIDKSSTPGYMKVLVEVYGLLPRGINHGTFVLTLQDGVNFVDLPKELFKQHMQAPNHVLNSWIEDIDPKS